MTVVSSSRGSKGNDPDHVVMRRADGSPIHVLVVDDEPVLAELVAMALRYEGWTVSTAGDGASAIAAARKEPPDVVVLDVMLPDMSGLDVLRKLRDQIPGTAVLLLTAKDARGGPHRRSDRGRRRLRHQAVQPRRGGAAAAGAAAPHRSRQPRQRIDDSSSATWCLTKTVTKSTRGGDEITLTTTEFELLRFMMRNARRVLSKAQILDRVWSYDFGGRSNIVELYVSYLRKKIDSGRVADDPHAARRRAMSSNPRD